MRARPEISKQAAQKQTWLRWAWAFLLAIGSLLPTAMLAQDHHADPAHSWTYFGEHGPQHWADLSPEFASCGTGQAQSPIDIAYPRAAQLPPIQFAYSAS